MKTALLTLGLLATQIALGAAMAPKMGSTKDKIALFSTPIQNPDLSNDKISELYSMFRGFSCNPKGSPCLPDLLVMRLVHHGFVWGHIQHNFVELTERLQTEVFAYEKKGGTPPFDLKSKIDFFSLIEQSIAAMSKKKAPAKK